LIAYLKGEPGEAAVEEWLVRGAAVSALTIQELVSKIVQGGGTKDDAVATADELGTPVHDLTQPLAIEVGAMITVTKPKGLSHGDRACLSLAKQLGVPAVTADRAWSDIADVLGVEIMRVR
jgi:PIN domain nuclease of toxin-antitoxin system